MLPEPQTSRFQPLRSGLINLYKYEDQEFCFEKGRLLLRGANGTGKSRVLALQLPFLLDGEISSKRVEPDGDSARQLAWHLHMNEHDDRSGYTWIEFGRINESGEQEFVTLGCGMRAGRHNQELKRWFFVTDQRVARDFRLLSENRQPLSSDQLVVRLGETALFKTAKEYRAEVDRRLFGLNEQRYKLLVELLIRLRAPQLARKLEEDKLSEALSDALPPPGEELVHTIADSFSSLDSLRKTLANHEAIKTHLEKFLKEYRRYLLVATLRRADQVRACHSEYEKQGRLRSEEEDNLEKAKSSLSAAEETKRLAQEKWDKAEAILKALQDSPYRKDAIDLDNARKDAEGAQDRLTNSENELNLRRIAEADARQSFELAKQEWNSTAGSFNEILAQSAAVAHDAGFIAQHQHLLPDVANWPPEHEQIKKALDAEVSDRNAAVGHLKKLQQSCNLAFQAYSQAKEAEAKAESEVTREREKIIELDQKIQQHRSHLLLQYTAWKENLHHLKSVETELLAEDLSRWIETGNSDQRNLTQHLSKALIAAENARVAAQTEIEQSQHELSEKIAKLQEEQCILESGMHQPPLVPVTRDTTARTRINGHPLWQLCDFVEVLSSEQQASLEAALESAGLLDALITPDGNLVFGENDSFILTANSSSLATHQLPSLNQWLRPAIPAHISGMHPDAVARALKQIAAGETELTDHWVDISGAWRLGPLGGRGHKETAVHIGESSRQQARERRLKEIREEQNKLAEQQQQLKANHFAISVTRKEEIAYEHKIAPNDEELSANITLRSDAYVRRQSVEESLDLARQHTGANRLAHQKCLDTRNDVARELKLSQWSEQVEALLQTWEKYRGTLPVLWLSAELYKSRSQQYWRTDQALNSAHGFTISADENQQKAQIEFNSKQRYYQNLQENVGSSVTELAKQTEVAENQKKDANDGLLAIMENIASAKAAQIAATAEIEKITKQIAEIAAERTAAIKKLNLLATNNLLQDIDEGLKKFEATEWPVSRAVEISREINDLFRDANREDKIWLQRQDVVRENFSELGSALGAFNYQPQMQLIDDGLNIVTCVFSGERMSLGKLHAVIIDNITEQNRLLNAKERELIDNHLIGDAAAELHKFIRDGQDHVKAMNGEIENCATTMGLSVRLLWQLRNEDDAPQGLVEAEKILLSKNTLWTPEERNQLGSFLHQHIADVRNNNPADSWYDHLRRALDYRTWHKFIIERKQNDKWERLTKKRYGTGSGGEKALMLTIPQMAAAASHYHSAKHFAPRLILLDEVFVGMDPSLRARCMGLLEAFDLDFVMTSEREWGAYPTISGLAIYQLTTRSNINAISAVRWMWNGRIKTLDTNANRQAHDPR
ncbi:MAG: TIGR02680 family protein [Verrucomicrobiales bacterium]|jgi:uncharacterized protein (TIGR02680 family)|nr:TIGR02680 family protein [Verrucomicrobiales bacterium]